MLVLGAFASTEAAGASPREGGVEMGAAGRAGTPKASTGEALLHLSVVQLTPEQRREAGLRVDTGVLVVAVGEGPAREAGIRPGDIILKLAGEPIGSPRQLEAVSRRLPPGRPAVVLIQRDESRVMMPLVLPG